jgi:hypothetical protein
MYILFLCIYYFYVYTINNIYKNRELINLYIFAISNCFHLQASTVHTMVQYLINIEEVKYA